MQISNNSNTTDEGIKLRDLPPTLKRRLIQVDSFYDEIEIVNGISCTCSY